MEKEKLTIIKVGGKIVEEKETLNQLLHDFSSIDGFKILVHGGGRSATKLAAQLGIESKMVDGRRITDAETLKIVTMVYGGLVNKNIVAGLQAVGVNALGLTGADMNIIRSDKRPVKEVDYGYVGDLKAENIDSGFILSLIRMGLTPVFCAITCDGNGCLLNTNADTVASGIAVSLASETDTDLIYCFEKDGVLADRNDDSTLIERIDPACFEKLKERKIVADGMLPKLENAFRAIRCGVGRVVIKNSSNIGNSRQTVLCAE